MWRRVLARGLPQAAAFGAAAYASAGLVRATGPEAAAPSPVRGLRNADVLLMADAQLERPRRRFEGKTILITGAGGSFGREGARYFASEGANIIAADMGEAALGDTRRAALEAEPSARVLTAVCDIRDRASVHALVEAGIAAFGSIDLCWNNAGLQGLMKPTLEYPADDFQMVMDVNVVGSFNVLQTVGRAMRDAGGGAIVTTASVAASRGTPTMPAYVASKAALVGLTLTAAKDLAPHNVRVNAISPALIGPGIMWMRQNELHASSDSPYFSRDPEAVALNKIASVPMRRLGTMSEVVMSVAFLLSDDASYTTGVNLVVAGGLA